MKTATDKSLVLLDEIGRGTSTLDGLAIAYAVLSYFIVDIRSLTLFVTHYPTLANFESTYPGLVGNIHMGFIEQETDLGKRVTFMYTAARGVALRSYGLNVARLAGIPEDIILKATEKSLQLEDRLTYKRQLVQVTKIITALKQISKGNIDSGDAAALIEDMRLYALV
jgi:DNA mismatch repair protein MSH3